MRAPLFCRAAAHKQLLQCGHARSLPLLRIGVPIRERGQVRVLDRGASIGKATLLAAAAALGLWAFRGAAATLSPEDAASHIGRNATVCGVVVSTKFDAHLPSQPTFLDFGKPYPDEVFAAVIFGADRPKFGRPEVTLQGHRVCVSGSINLYQNKPAIVLGDPRQLTQ